ncbi:MAG: DHH family phosphoesterase, partial [Candidatus Thermoplasmatota archaeon]|nr:DHH family phosphoesterase [Candidatus Thermoplasmatota archaeon]
TITRKIAWTTGKNTIVINPAYFPDKTQVYVRSTINIEPMIQRGKDLGFKCGGKKEVLGAILPNNQTDDFVKEIITFLSKT